VNSNPLRVRSFAKINLALAVLAKRSDGYHEIRTVFQSIDLFDDLEIRPCSSLQLVCPELASVPLEENTVWRAAAALARCAAPGAGAEIVLHKRIPQGAGLGGGSSNAAAALLGLARFWNLNVAAEDLQSIAAGIGSDVPFFLQGGTALGIGRGEEIYPLPEIRPEALVVVYPGVRVPTAAAYQSLNLELTSRTALRNIQGFCGQLAEGCASRTGIFNDFERTILPAYPAVREAKDFLIGRNAAAVMLSGSGSSVFGFFTDEESALAASRDSSIRDGWRVFPAKTLPRAQYFQSMFG
jgi:4-diphosphocytidyl-2-C-methyl-D-erythritol kinase